jgi:hypothetical protein
VIAFTVTVRVSDQSLREAGSRIPRAISDSITDSLKAAQTTQRRAMGEKFTIRRPQFRDLSVKITEFPRRDKLTGELAIRAPGDRSNIFGKFEIGGTKTARGGGLIAVPLVGTPVKPTTGSIVKPQFRPRALLQGTRQGQTLPPPLTRVFVRNTAQGGKVIFGEVGATNSKGKGKAGRRLVAGPSQVRPLYLLIRKAPIEDRLDFADTVTRSVAEAWAPAFTRRWAEQQARARR